MKTQFYGVRAAQVLGLALITSLAVHSQASTATGHASISVTPDRGFNLTVEVREQDGKIIGQGNRFFGNDNNTIYLARKADGGLEGFVFGRPFNISCTATACEDMGSTNMSLQRSEGGKFSGSFNFEPVTAVQTATSISVTSDGSFEATGSGDGNYKGRGAFSYGRPGFFDVEIKSDGSLKGINDPALFAVLILNSMTR